MTNDWNDFKLRSIIKLGKDQNKMIKVMTKRKIIILINNRFDQNLD